ncbi:MAG: hypothetical protein DRH37_05320 [Deltaproteobacteria bacterium]|nr:MAG: hypothetical protein DRH37_05320 [Deltaproteobacteria bacterium]
MRNELEFTGKVHLPHRISFSPFAFGKAVCTPVDPSFPGYLSDADCFQYPFFISQSNADCY